MQKKCEENAVNCLKDTIKVVRSARKKYDENAKTNARKMRKECEKTAMQLREKCGKIVRKPRINCEKNTEKCWEKPDQNFEKKSTSTSKRNHNSLIAQSPNQTDKSPGYKVSVGRDI